MFILQMSGFPGSGKSSLAIEISSRTGAVVIDRDIIKTSLQNKGMTEKFSADYSYGVTFDLARYYLSIGKSVIIDTPCYYQDILDQGIQLSSDKIKYRYIECVVSDFEIIKERVKNRKTLRSQITVTTYENFLKAKGRVKRPDNGLQLDTTRMMLVNVEEALIYLNKGENR